MIAGNVVWADLNPVVGHEQAGKRPVLVVGDQIRGLLQVVPLTTTDRDLPMHVRLESLGGDQSPSIVMCEQIRTISTTRVVDSAGQVAAHELDAVRRMIGWLIEVPA